MKILCSTALKAAVLEIIPLYEEEEGITVNVTFGPTNALIKELDSSIQTDLVIFTQDAVQNLLNTTLLQGPRTDIASTGIGVAMKKGLKKPDIAQIDSFKQFLLDAPSLAYTSDGVSGLYVEQLILSFNMTEALVAKTKRIKGGLAAELIMKGDVLYALQNISELASVDGVEIIGPLPKEIQKVTTFSGAIASRSRNMNHAVNFLKKIVSPEARAIFRIKGLDPIEIK